jgi:hypothetical protein
MALGLVQVRRCFRPCGATTSGRLTRTSVGASLRRFAAAMLDSDDVIGKRFYKEHDGLTRTRPDPLAGAWDTELLALVQTSPHFNGVTLLPAQPVNVASLRTSKPLHPRARRHARTAIRFLSQHLRHGSRCQNKHTLPITPTLRKGPRCVTF